MNAPGGDRAPESPEATVGVVEAEIFHGHPFGIYLAGPLTLFVVPVLAVLRRLESHLGDHARSHDPRTDEIDGAVLERMARLEDEAHDARSVQTARLLTVALLALSGMTTAYALVTIDWPPRGWEWALPTVALGYHLALVLGPFTLWVTRRVRRHEQAATGLRALEDGVPSAWVAATLERRARHWRGVGSMNAVWLVAMLALPLINLPLCLLMPYLAFGPLLEHERHERGGGPRLVPSFTPTQRCCSFCGASPLERGLILGSEGEHPPICDQCAFALAERFAVGYRRTTDRTPPLGDDRLAGDPEDD